MINLYSTPTDIKSHLGDGISQAVEKYDPIFVKMIGAVSRLIDSYTGRSFYPSYETRYFDGSGHTRLWVDDLISLESLFYSLDQGVNYTAYTANDYILTRAGNRNTRAAFDCLLGNVGGNYPIFPAGQSSIKAVGWWAYHENRSLAWETALPLAAGINSTETVLAFSSTSGKDQYGISPLFQAGQLIKIESEICAVTLVDQSENKLTVIRGLNGTTGAAHAISTPAYIWRTPALASEACTMQATRLVNRAWQGFADGRATPELAGQILWTKKLDPEVVTLLETLVMKL